jgi:hypothetical protein
MVSMEIRAMPIIRLPTLIGFDANSSWDLISSSFYDLVCHPDPTRATNLSPILCQKRTKRLGYGHLKYFTVIWHILWPFGNVVVIWYIFPRFGILCQEKYGNPAFDSYFGE